MCMLRSSDISYRIQFTARMAGQPPIRGLQYVWALLCSAAMRQNLSDTRKTNLRPGQSLIHAARKSGDGAIYVWQGRRPTCLDPPSDDWQELLHERKDALPQPVLKRWHADPTQIGLLRNAGQSCAPCVRSALGLLCCYQPHGRYVSVQ